MCGIIGYFGGKNAYGIAVSGLRSLEYRGYDSYGIALLHNNKLELMKKVGKVSELKESSGKKGNIAIAHTRWATHGKVTEKNAHPHLSQNGKIAVVHNGIIENHSDLKKFLGEGGYNFTSETDSEVIPQMIQYIMEKQNSDFFNACKETMKKIEGRNAFVALDSEKEEIVAARRGSPLVLGVGEDELFLASDVPAFLKHTKRVVFLSDNEIVRITKGEYEIIDLKTGEKIERKVKHITWNAEEAEKGDYEHFMIKEIMEQRETILRAVAQNEKEIGKVAEMIKAAFGTFFVGCGTAGKVALEGTYLFSAIAKKHVNFAFGSEFPNYHHFLTPKTLLVAISQSGETADTLEAIEEARKRGCKIVSILNVEGSTMQRLSDVTILIKSGPEKAVCSTKATTAQLAIMVALAYCCNGGFEEAKKLVEETQKKINEVVFKDKNLDKIKSLAEKIQKHESMYLIGRGQNFPIAQESAIKLQEVSYIHAEAFAGGELKHGPIALIEKGTPCIALCAEDETWDDTISNATEVKARGGFIIGVSPKNNEIFDVWLETPECGLAQGIANLIPVQLLAYYLGITRGCSVDTPRNLAKAVSVK